VSAAGDADRTIGTDEGRHQERVGCQFSWRPARKGFEVCGSHSLETTQVDTAWQLLVSVARTGTHANSIQREPHSVVASSRRRIADFGRLN
jgi:hypothetical protein